MDRRAPVDALGVSAGESHLDIRLDDVCGRLAARVFDVGTEKTVEIAIAAGTRLTDEAQRLATTNL